MTRVLGIFGLGVGFLLISPALRNAAVDAVHGTLSLLAQYSPYSYAGVAVLAFGGITFTLVSGSSPR